MEKSSNDPIEEIQAAGPGAVDEAGIAPEPLLNGASEFEYVEVLNPLSVPFTGVFGVTRPVKAPIKIDNDPRAPGATQSEGDLRVNYGLDLRNPNHQGKANITNKVTIPSGQTVRLLGNEAQVIVRQLVNEMMQREGKRLMLADAHARHEYEKRIVMRRGSVEEILGRQPQTVQQQLQQVKEQPSEEFPGAGRATEPTETSADSRGEAVERSDGAEGSPTAEIPATS